jgi:hypothetical protein
MAKRVARRDFLKSSAAVAGVGMAAALPAFPARAATVEAPIIDRLSVRVLVDSSFDLFIRPAGPRRRARRIPTAHRLPQQLAQRMGIGALPRDPARQRAAHLDA